MGSARPLASTMRNSHLSTRVVYARERERERERVLCSRKRHTEMRQRRRGVACRGEGGNEKVTRGCEVERVREREREKERERESWGRLLLGVLRCFCRYEVICWAWFEF